MHACTCMHAMADLFSGYCSFNAAHVDVHQPCILHPLSAERLVQPMPPEHNTGDSQLSENRLTIQTTLEKRCKVMLTKYTTNGLLLELE